MWRDDAVDQKMPSSNLGGMRLQIIKVHPLIIAKATCRDEAADHTMRPLIISKAKINTICIESDNYQ